MSHSKNYRGNDIDIKITNGSVLVYQLSEYGTTKEQMVEIQSPADLEVLYGLIGDVLQLYHTASMASLPTPEELECGC